MLKLALAFAILAMSGPSVQHQAQGPDPSWVEPPPAEYDRAPDRPFAVVVGTPLQVHVACGGVWPLTPGAMVYLACTYTDQRVVVFPHCPAGREAYCGALWRHELAHLNGWRH